MWGGGGFAFKCLLLQAYWGNVIHRLQTWYLTRTMCHVVSGCIMACQERTQPHISGLSWLNIQSSNTAWISPRPLHFCVTSVARRSGSGTLNEKPLCPHLSFGRIPFRIWVIFPAGSRDFSLLHSVQTGSGSHPASYPMGTGGCLPGGKAVVAWSWPLTFIKCWG
jgi:hypothetical protein